MQTFTLTINQNEVDALVSSLELYLNALNLDAKKQNDAETVDAFAESIQDVTALRDRIVKFQESPNAPPNV